MLTLLLNPDLSPVAEDPFLSQFWLKLWVFNMDPKGPSSTFKRSSLKRTTSGSQKVRWSLFGAHSTGDSETALTSFHVLSWGEKCFTVFYCVSFLWNVVMAFILKVNVWCCFTNDQQLHFILASSSTFFSLFCIPRPYDCSMNTQCHMGPSLWVLVLVPNQSLQSLFVPHNDTNHSRLPVICWCAHGLQIYH